jgi:hypothetical protein
MKKVFLNINNNNNNNYYYYSICGHKDITVLWNQGLKTGSGKPARHNN